MPLFFAIFSRVTIHGMLLCGFTTDALVRTVEPTQKHACEAGTSPTTADF